MKYTLTTTDTGACIFSTATEFTPPNGLVIPSNQTVKTVIPTARTLASIFTSCSPAIPVGFRVEVYQGSIYAKETGVWVDEETSENADNVSISGTVFFSNFENYDIGITW